MAAEPAVGEVAQQAVLCPPPLEAAVDEVQDDGLTQRHRRVVAQRAARVEPRYAVCPAH